MYPAVAVRLFAEWKVNESELFYVHLLFTCLLETMGNTSVVLINDIDISLQN